MHSWTPIDRFYLLGFVCNFRFFLFRIFFTFTQLQAFEVEFIPVTLNIDDEAWDLFWAQANRVDVLKVGENLDNSSASEYQSHCEILLIFAWTFCLYLICRRYNLDQLSSSSKPFLTSFYLHEAKLHIANSGIRFFIVKHIRGLLFLGKTLEFISVHIVFGSYF